MSFNASKWAIAAIVCMSATPCMAISVSTDILNGGSASPGVLANNAGSAGAQVNMVKFIPLNQTYSAVAYNTNGTTFDLSAYVSTASCCERGAGQNLHINGYSDTSTPNQNLYLRGNPNVNNPGFGAHANWLVTIDLNQVRAAHFGNTTNPLQLTGDFGAWGSIGDGSAAAGVIQGGIYLDGARIDSMVNSVANPVAVNQSFNLNIASGQYLTFTILNGSNSNLQSSTLWDDGLFQNVNLVAVPEPSSLLMLSMAAACLFAVRRRNS